MGRGNARERLGLGCKGADSDARSGQPAELGVGGRIGPQVDAGVVLCEPFQQCAPVADGCVERRLVGSVVQLDPVAALRILQPCSPERLGVPEDGVEVDDDSGAVGHATTLRTARPST